MSVWVAGHVSDEVRKAVVGRHDNGDRAGACSLESVVPLPTRIVGAKYSCEVMGAVELIVVSSRSLIAFKQDVFISYCVGKLPLIWECPVVDNGIVENIVGVEVVNHYTARARSIHRRWGLNVLEDVTHD